MKAKRITTPPRISVQEQWVVEHTALVLQQVDRPTFNSGNGNEHNCSTNLYAVIMPRAAPFSPRTGAVAGGWRHPSTR